MKFLSFLLFLISFNTFSQVDKGTSIAIPATKNDTRSISIPSTSGTNSSPNIDFSTFSKPKSDKFKIGESEGVNFGAKKEAFGNPAEGKDKEMNKKYGKEPQFAPKGNQYFGDFKNNGDYVNLKFRDFGLEDGDLIKISVNDVVVVASLRLTNDYKILDLPLKIGFNKIDFEALNQGFSGPNTAEFHVFDDKGKLIASNQWNLATGFKATVIIIKEE